MERFREILCVLLLLCLPFGIHAEQSIKTPCPNELWRPHTVEAEMRGSGLCDGDFKMILSVPSAGVNLIHHSLSPFSSFGIGKGFALDIEKYFEKLSAIEAKLVWGDGRSIAFHFDSDKGAWVPKRSRESDLWFTESGTVLMEYTPQKTTTRFDWNAALKRHLITSASDPRGGTIQFVRYTTGLLKEFIYPDNGKDVYGYDSKGRIASITDRGGFKYELIYDGQDQLKTIKAPDRSVIALTYKAGLVESITDGLGRKSKLDYYTGGLLKFYTDPKGFTSRYVYSSNQVKVSSPFTEYQENFDSAGRLIGVTQNGLSQSWTLDANGRYSSYTNGLGQVTQFYYDGSSELPNKQVRPDGATIETQYNVQQLISELKITINGKPVVASFKFNEMHQKTEIEINGHKEVRNYDSFGNLRSVLQVTGEQYSMEYDARNRLIKLVDGVGYQTVLGYDGDKNWVRQVQLPNGTVKNWTYDKLGRVTSESNNRGYYQSYSYRSAFEPSAVLISFANGNLKEEISREDNRSASGANTVKTLWRMGGKTLLDETLKMGITGKILEEER